MNRRSIPNHVGAFLLLICAGCLSPEAYLRQADKEAYALVDARRAELFGEESGFTVNPPEDSLRQRILRGEYVQSEPWGLLDCMAIAAENNRDFQTEREALFLSALDLTVERWRLSFIPSGGAGGRIDGTGREGDSSTLDAGGTLSKVLGTGANIVAGIGASLFRLVRTGDGWETVSDLSLSITQPLMSGSGRRIQLESLTQAERNLVYDVRAYERFRREFGVDVASQVYDLLQAIVLLENEEANYDDLLVLSERNRALAEAGQLSDIEADQARQDELRSENTLLTLRARVQQQRDQFLIFLGLPIGTPFELDFGEFEKLVGDDPLLDRIEDQLAEDVALLERLDLQTTLDQYTDAERQIYIARDALRLGLDVSVNASALSVLDEPLEFRGDSSNWSAGLALDLPWSRIPQRNAYRRTLINVERAWRNLEQRQDQLRADVRQALRNVRNSRASWRIQQGAVALAKRRVENANLSLQAGRSSTRDVLESQEDQVAAQNAETTALIDFTLARLNLYLQLEALRVDESGLYVEEDIVLNGGLSEEPGDGQ